MSNELRILDAVWLAGLLEGEGCFRFDGTPSVVLDMTDQDVVEHAGTIMGKECHQRNSRFSPAWRIKLCGYPAIEVMESILPYMGQRRTKTIQNIIKLSSERPHGINGKPHTVIDANWIPFIRELVRRGVSQRKVSQLCDVAHGTINQIITGKTWKHIPE